MDVPEIPAATAALARKVHPRGTDEMRVRDTLGRRGSGPAAFGGLVGLQPEPPHPADHVAVAVDAGLRAEDPDALVGCGAGYPGALALVGGPHMLEVHTSPLGHARSSLRVDGQDAV